MKYTKDYMIRFIQDGLRNTSNIAGDCELPTECYVLVAYSNLEQLVELFGEPKILQDATATELAYILNYSLMYPECSLAYCVLLERLMS